MLKPDIRVAVIALGSSSVPALQPTDGDGNL